MLSRQVCEQCAGVDLPIAESSPAARTGTLDLRI
jgi:hypothetical protein